MLLLLLVYVVIYCKNKNNDVNKFRHQKSSVLFFEGFPCEEHMLAYLLSFLGLLGNMTTYPYLRCGGGGHNVPEPIKKHYASINI
jgi:hypothetical protein